MPTGTESKSIWELNHSDHQVLALVGQDLVASRRLKRREVEALRRRLSDGPPIPPSDRYCTVPVADIEHLVADDGKRQMVVVTPDHEVELPGFRSRATTWFRQQSTFDKHDPQNPDSQVAVAAAVIAEAAGLQLESDPRAEVLHYRRNPESSTQAPSPVADQFRVRPWLPAAYAALCAAWMAAWLVPMRGWLDETASSRLVVQLLLVGAVVALAVASTTMAVARAVTVDSVGMRGVTMFRDRLIPWPDVTLVHGVVDRESPLGRRRVQLVRMDGRCVMLPPLTKTQVLRLAAAIQQHGRPYGIGPNLPPGDFSRRYAPDRLRVTSAIAISIFWWKF